VANPIDPSFRHAVTSLSQPGLLVDCRLVGPEDDRALLEVEAASIASRVDAARQASGAARLLGRELMAQLGVPPAPIPNDASGAPIWPEGLIGSFAHDDTIAVAAVGLRQVAASAGIDIEPAIPLPADVRELVLTAAEQTQTERDPCGGRLVFAVKEAVYKAVHPLDQTFLEYHDIDVDLERGQAITNSGRRVSFRAVRASHLVALALT